MKRSIQLIAVCLSIIALLCSVAVIVGRIGAKQELLPELGLCESTPCYLGIIPGKTTWQDAKAILLNTPDLDFNFSTNSAYQLPRIVGKMQILLSDEVVSEIDIVPHKPNLSIGQVINVLGIPCSISLIGNSDMVIAYPQISMLVAAKNLGDSRVLRPNFPVFQINLLGRFKSCEQLHANSPYKWQGFGIYPKLP